MSSLTVYHSSSPQLPNKVLTHAEDIAATLAEVGVTFARRQVETPVQAGAAREELLDSCRVQLDELQTEQGASEVEVLSLQRNHPEQDEPPIERRTALGETHWFVAGRGLLNLHLGDFVYALLGEKHDLVVLPAGTRYWLDAGERPRLALVRLFRGEAEPSGDDIAGRFPRLED
ncbi:MAG: acireductone dioxygenase [Pseudomonadaceae bacterium]|nr:acireductone dioxygenase [Pseudomonadaceae bacterium]